MPKIRRKREPGQFSRPLTQWGLTLLVIITLFLLASEAYNLMIGQYTASPAARRDVHPVLVNGPQMPTPAQPHAGNTDSQAG